MSVIEQIVCDSEPLICFAADENKLFVLCEVNSLCRRFKDLALQFHEPARAILPLKTAVHKLQPSPEYLTPLHAEFLLVCLLAKCYKSGLDVLEEDIFEIDQKRTGLVIRDFLLYCYYGCVTSYSSFSISVICCTRVLFAGWWLEEDASLQCADCYCRGMVYIGLKRFAKALEFLQHVCVLSLGFLPGCKQELLYSTDSLRLLMVIPPTQAITAPAHGLNAITIAAFKKYVLVCLIHNGQVSTPRTFAPLLR